MKGDDVKNNKRVSTWFIVMLIVATGGFFIWVENPLIHISTMEKKLNASLIVAGICITILLFDDAIVRLWQMIISRSYFQRFNLLSGLSNSGRKSKKAIKNSRAEILNHVLTYLRQSYGRRWRAKTRILLVMGDASQVEQLVPKLTTQRWVEGDGVVLIWGGTLTETPDASLFDAIRKLHRRPLDGIVWVTPTFQHQDTLVQSAPVVSSREYAASLAQQLVTLWPEESQVATFVSGLQKELTTEALPESALQNWHNAQQGLEALTAQLNTLDERKGKYLTGSELKSAIFTIRRQLDQTPPTEELLRQIDEELKKQGSVSPALYQQLDMRINQLLNRYALLKQNGIRGR